MFRQDGQFYAYSNTCLHQGGPACEGLIIAKVEEQILADGRPRAASISPRTSCISSAPGTATNMTCGPASSPPTAGMRLKKFQVVQSGDDVFVVA